jgi:hypothetical protein
MVLGEVDLAGLPDSDLVIYEIGAAGQCVSIVRI